MIRALCIATLLATVSLARADDRGQAKQLYDQGVAHFNLGEYGKAIEVWKESYRLSKAPLLLFNLGQAYRLSGDCSQATTFYDNYLREQPEASNLDEVEQVMTLCKDAPVKPAAPVPAPIERAPPPPPPPVRERVSTTGRPIGVAVIAVGAVAAGVAVYFAIDSKRQSDDLDGFVGTWMPAQRDQEARGQRSEKLAWGLGITGVLAAGAGTALILTSYRWRERPARLGIVPVKQGAIAGVSLRF